MNSVYMVVEGSRTEPLLYSAWLPYLLPGFVKHSAVEGAADEDGYYIVAGFGYPSILSRIEAAIADVCDFPGFSRLVVALDCEERTVAEVETEVTGLIPTSLGETHISIDVVVANCAIETWLLGNRRFVKRQPTTQPLVSYRQMYDVTRLDPELMNNPMPQRFTTRAQFHKAYLRAAFQERGLSYSETRPGQAMTDDYLKELVRRTKSTEPAHLKSFARLLHIMDAHLAHGRRLKA